MKKFILRIMACLMIAAMIGTSFGTTKASAAEGKFTGAYGGDYSAEWIPASAFEGCENGAVVTFTNRKATADEGWSNPYWNFTFIQNTDGWPKLLDASLYAEGTRPAFSEWDFADVTGEPYTTTFSAEGVAKILSTGDLGIQVAGVVLLDWTVTPVAGSEPADEPVVDEPVVDEPVVDEPVVDEPVVDEPVVDEPVVDEPVVDEPVVDEPVVDEPVVDEPADAPVADKTGDAVVLVGIVAIAAALALVYNRKRVNA